jgi:hypothetical protein
MITSKFNRRGPRGRRLAIQALAATIAGGGLAAVLAAGTASAATAPAPAAGVAPGATVAGSTREVGYTASGGSVWLRNLSTGAVTSVGGHLVGAPGLMGDGSTVLVFGQGPGGHLWESSCTLSGRCGAWQSLGGTITSSPSAALSGPAPEEYSVYARGGNGAVWTRAHTASGWGGWRSLGGNLLAGTGPAAAYVTGDGPYTLVTGTNHELYVEGPGVTGFNPAGGRTNSGPALTAIPAAQGQPAALVGFVRGTDNAGYYHRFIANTPSWHSMGGRLTTGPAAFTQSVTTIPTTFTYAQGTDHQIYQNAGTWAAPTPGLTGWRLTGWRLAG